MSYSSLTMREIQTVFGVRQIVTPDLFAAVPPRSISKNSDINRIYGVVTNGQLRQFAVCAKTRRKSR